MGGMGLKTHLSSEGFWNTHISHIYTYIYIFDLYIYRFIYLNQSNISVFLYPFFPIFSRNIFCCRWLGDSTLRFFSYFNICREGPT